MAEITYSYIAALRNAFSQGGRIKLIACKPGEMIPSDELERLLREYSPRNGSLSDCDSLCLENFDLLGNLNLSGLGREGAPVLPMQFVNCNVIGKLNANYAYLKGFEFRGEHNALARITSIAAKGVTVIDTFCLLNLQLSRSGRIDLSESRLKSGLTLYNVSGWSDPASDKALAAFARVSISRSTLGSSVDIIGVHVCATDRIAFDAEYVQIDGTLKLGCTNPQGTRCNLYGELCLRGADIKGQLIFEGIHSVAPHSDTGPTFAMTADGASVGGDVYFKEPDRRSELECRVEGQIDLTGLHAGGDVIIYGTFIASQSRIRAFRANRINIGGDLRFGYAPAQDRLEGHSCKVVGECDFSSSVIGGKVIFSGSDHVITPEYTPPTGVKRQQKQAVNFAGCNIGRDLWLESGESTCNVEGLACTGAVIGGRIILQGVKIAAAKSSAANKCISSNGATIRGGILVTARQENNPERQQGKRHKMSSLTGGIRLRNATIDGPVQFLGVDIDADSNGKAIWASNTRFGSDVLIQPYDDFWEWEYEELPAGPVIRGELRFQGAKIHGRFWVQGLTLKADAKSGVAIDCFTAEVRRSLAIGSFCPSRTGNKGQTTPCEVTGVVSLVSLQAQSVTIGANPSAPIHDKQQRLELTGALLMREMKLQSQLLIANTLIRPTEQVSDDRLKTRMLSLLEQWGVSRSRCIIHANYAILGTRLFVRLLSGSTGLISLYGAKTGTIGGYFKDIGEQSHGWVKKVKKFTPGRSRGDSTIDPKYKEYWGPLPTELSAFDCGRPRSPNDAKGDILLNLDAFTYDRTNDAEEPSPKWGWNPLSFIVYVFFYLSGRPSAKKIGPRFQWLQRDVGNPGAQEKIIISAHRRLAHVYRDMGKLQRAYSCTRERRWLQILYGELPRSQKAIDYLYSVLFGFGYSSKRAVGTLGLLWIFSLCFVWFGLGHRPQCSVEDSASCPLAWDSPARPILWLPKAPPSETSIQNRSSISSIVNSLVPEPQRVTSCLGSLCLPNPGSPTATVHLPLTPFDPYVLLESMNLISPLTRLGSNMTLVLHKDADIPTHVWYESLNILSWIFFPLAIGTITGVLRENL